MGTEAQMRKLEEECMSLLGQLQRELADLEEAYSRYTKEVERVAKVAAGLERHAAAMIRERLSIEGERDNGPSVVMLTTHRLQGRPT